MAKKQALGKGISALIPDYPEATEEDGPNRVIYLNVDEIEPNPHQPRTEFDEERIDELSSSIREKGVIQPIAVNRVGQSYELIAGERRWRATVKAGYKTIPALIHEIDSVQELMEISLIENTQREDLNPIEEAEGYRALVTTCMLKPEEVAKKVGKDRSTVANLIRLLNLPQEIQGYLRSGELQSGHARALLGLENEIDQLELGHRCVRNKMTVRDIENAVKSRRSGRDKIKRLPTRETQPDPHVAEFEGKLRHHYGTGVSIRTGTKQGRIEIEFYNRDDLERLLELLLGLDP
jgi:ParB family chromosome partitioning protein